MNNIKQGFGTYTYRNGIKYEGEYKNNIMSGKGLYIYPTGSKVKVNFQDGNKINYKSL